MVIEILLFILGILFLYKGSDWFVGSSSRIARYLGASPFIIGISLVALGTSIPEVASVITSSLQGQTALIVGDVVGSNITNIALIFGLILFLGQITIKKSLVKKEIGIMILVTSIFFLLGIDGGISRLEGMLLLLIYFVYLTYTFTSKEHKQHYGVKDFIHYLLHFEYVEDIKELTHKKKSTRKKISLTVGRECLLLFLGLAAIVLGARWLIQGALFFADTLGIATGIIGLTIVAFGTSAPEISVAIRSIKRGLAGLSVGDVVGSNITNLLFVMGIASIIAPIQLFKETLNFAAPLLILLSILMYTSVKTNKKIPRWKGLLFITIYIAYLVTLLTLGKA